MSLKTKEELEALGIDFSAENNNELHPSVNRGFQVTCRRCGCDNVAITYFQKRDTNVNYLIDEPSILIKCFVCPNCKLVEEI